MPRIDINGIWRTWCNLHFWLVDDRPSTWAAGVSVASFPQLCGVPEVRAWTTPGRSRSRPPSATPQLVAPACHSPSRIICLVVSDLSSSKPSPGGSLARKIVMSITFTARRAFPSVSQSRDNQGRTGRGPRNEEKRNAETGGDTTRNTSERGGERERERERVRERERREAEKKKIVARWSKNGRWERNGRWSRQWEIGTEQIGERRNAAPECRWIVTVSLLNCSRRSLASHSPLALFRAAALRLGRVRVVYEDYRYR